MILCVSGGIAYALYGRAQAKPAQTAARPAVETHKPQPASHAEPAPQPTPPEAKSNAASQQKTPTTTEDRTRVIRFSDNNVDMSERQVRLRACNQKLNDMYAEHNRITASLTQKKAAALAELESMYSSGAFAKDPDGNQLTTDQQYQAYQLARSYASQIYDDKLMAVARENEAADTAQYAECQKI